MIRFHLDESVPHAVAEGLRARAIDVTTTTDAGLVGADDRVQLEFARDSGRILVTRDADFLVLARDFVDHAGIVYAYPRRTSIGAIIRVCVQVVQRRTAEEMKAAVAYVPQSRSL